MIEAIKESDKEEIFLYLKKYFNVNYKSLAPFEKIFIYKNTKICGFISYSMIYERAELNYLFVLPDDRKKKIASYLIEKMLEDLKKNSIVQITLEVREDNIKAINLYKKFGFKNISIRKNYYQKKDGILMLKEIGE